MGTYLLPLAEVLAENSICVFVWHDNLTYYIINMVVVIYFFSLEGVHSVTSRSGNSPRACSPAQRLFGLRPGPDLSVSLLHFGLHTGPTLGRNFIIRPILGLGLSIHPGQGGEPNNIVFVVDNLFFFF